MIKDEEGRELDAPVFRPSTIAKPFTPWIGQTDHHARGRPTEGRVEVMARNRSVYAGQAHDFDWSWEHSMMGSDIVGYRSVE